MINADATQCRTSGEITRKVRVKVNKGRNSSIDPMKVLPVKNESLTAFFIKYYMIFSAGGSLAPPIFIIANDDMKEGVINVQKVNGLGMGVDPNPIGYLVFCKSRGLCHEFYEWMLNEIVVPYVNKIKLHKSLNNDSTSWLTLDGESKQIIPMMKEGSQMILNDNNIIVTKPPGSTSHVTQPADVGKVFKAIKTTIVGLFDDNLNDNDFKDEIMIKIKCHEESNMKNMIAAYRQKICTGLMKMHRAINKVINPDIIRESFAETGMYDPSTHTYNLEKMISKHKVPMAADEKLHFVESIPKLARIIGDKGQLSEAALTRAGLPETTIKDNKTLIQQRTVFLTNPAIVQEEKRKADIRNEAKAAATIKANKRKISSTKKTRPRKSRKLSKSYVNSSDDESSSNYSDSDY